MNNKKICVLVVLAALSVMCLGIGAGSVGIPLQHQLQIYGEKLFGFSRSVDIPASEVTILMTIRMPRVLLSFLVGGGLAIAGVVTQSVLQNPLASSYTLGVSSGAALGAAIMTVLEVSIPVLGIFLLPLGGFAGGLLVVMLVMGFSARIDHGVSSQTVVLIGMVASMFTNAVLMLLSILFVQHEHQILVWTMGSFNGKRWMHPLILFIADAIALVVLLSRHRELDILSFGDERAMSMGVNASRDKLLLLIASSLLTGVSVCFTGTIGFVDLIAPHVSRRLVGASHRWMLPVSFLLGGTLMTAADLISRTVFAPIEIPVGAVTALIGAPFFVWLYFGTSKGGVRG